MRVKDVARPDQPNEQLRTEVGSGILNNRTRPEITENDTWKIAQVIGPFPSEEAASAFARAWTTAGDGEHAQKATRGPIVRSARGEALAGWLDLACWIDYSVVWNCKQIHWTVAIVNNQVVARRKLERHGVSVNT